MASKLQEYRRMSEEAQRQLTGSLERWQSFLATASRLYKYPYHEQVMIHAQRPDATACAEFDVWNNTMRRYVRRGSKGIALIDTSGDRERLRYVFDVSDTGTRPNSRSLNLWELREEHIPAVSSMLEKSYGVPAGENVVICKDFSRFFRDYVEIGDYLERIFPFLGVRFIAVNDGYDSDDYKGSTAGMEVVMKYIVYSYYSRDLSQKIKTVMSTRKSKGEFVASQAPYGYMKDPDVKRKIIPNPDTAPVVRKIFDLALEGKTPAEIAVVLNDYKLETPSAYFMRMNPGSKKFRTSSQEACSTSNNVREILKRREYTGVMVMNQRRWKGLDNPRTVWTDESEWQIIPDCHEAIISESEYEEAQKVFRKIRKGYDRSPNQYLLRSLVHCGACGRAMQRQKHSPVIYYTCLKSVSNRETACPVGERFIEADLERIVKNDLLEKLRLLVDVDDRLYAAAAASEGTEENIRFRLEQIEKRMKQISVSRVSAYERYAEGRLQRDICPTF